MSVNKTQKELLESLERNLQLKVEVLNFTDSNHLQVSVMFNNKVICADSIEVQSLLQGGKQ